jgi:hypothetical protein
VDYATRASRHDRVQQGFFPQQVELAMDEDSRADRQDNSDRAPQPKPISQDFSHQPVAARISETVSPGVFSTGIMVLQTGDEFAIDFLSTMVQPKQIVARVILTPNKFAQLITALRANLAKYEDQYGPTATRGSVSAGTEAGQRAAANGVGKGAGTPSQTPAESGQSASPLDVSELYDQLKLPDELAGGVFANAVMIRHAAEEFVLDFIANFYPRSVVTARVYLAAGRVPATLETLSNSLEKYRRKRETSGPDGREDSDQDQ